MRTSNILCGTFDPLGDKGEPLKATYIRPSRRLINHFSGFDYIYIGHWVTNLTNKGLAECPIDFKVSEAFPVDLGIDVFPEVRAYRISVAPLFHDTHSLRFFPESFLLGGRHLRISLATRCGDCAGSRIYEAARMVANVIRIRLGLPAASSLGIESVFRVADQTSSFDGRYHIFPEFTGGGQDASSYLHFVSDEQIPSTKLPADVHALLNAAFQADEPWDRFLFLWFALEVVTSPDGRERSRFCRSVLGSEAINNEMLYLRNIRVKIAHFGGAQVNSADLTSLLWLFRISSLPACAFRVKLAQAYEDWLETRRQQP